MRVLALPVLALVPIAGLPSATAQVQRRQRLLDIGGSAAVVRRARRGRGRSLEAAVRKAALTHVSSVSTASANSPFELTPNPKYLFLTPRHREALSNLQYGLSSAKAVTVLIGEAGTGKTTLLRAALESDGAATSGACT